MALGLTHPLTEMNTRNLPEERKAANLTAICDLEKVGSSMSHNPIGLHGLLQG
jgi:hypothetical protein